jgi:aminoglycoside phosphotransferase family enzyme/predicted kinase
MAIPASQDSVAALLREIVGAEPGTGVVETHISALFIGADTVLKLRKAVRLSFVDFTSVAARERAARREFELDAPAAPGLYRDVIPVLRRADGTLALGEADADGEPVDWVVRMARVPRADFLDVMAAEHRLDAALLDALADAVAAYHAALPPSGRDWAAALRGVIEGNAASAREAGLPEPMVRQWRDAALGAHAALLPWLRQRAAGGFVRRAHGDLHLGNLCLWQGRPVPFDALEFDEDLATIDVAYDFAFLLMDLDHRAGRAAANRVMNRYVARTGDADLVCGLKLFLSLRAMVRAHVEASRGRAGPAAAYLERACGALAPAAPVLEAPVLLAIGGLPGTGKSTVARALAPALGAAPGALILRSDEIRKRRHGVPPERKLPASAYAEPESRAVMAELAAAAARAVAAGHAVIADATFMDPADRAAIEAAAGAAPFLGIWLTAPLAVLEARVAARTGDASDADLAVLRRAAAAAPGAGIWASIDATDAEPALAAIRSRLPAG